MAVAAPSRRSGDPARREVLRVRARVLFRWDDDIALLVSLGSHDEVS
jgi:hypothetical protein